MESGSEYLLESSFVGDPSWLKASQISRKYFSIPSHVEHLFRSGWIGDLSVSEYMRILGFSRLEPICLLRAADISEVQKGRDAIEQSISVLGARFSAVVLAINFLSRTIQQNSDSPLLEYWLQQLINNVEVGYRLGGKTFTAGIEGGSLCGMAQVAGHLALMIEMPKEFSAYHRALQKEQKLSTDEVQDLFGCEPYQISSCIIQRLGFGKELALGVALGGYRAVPPGELETDPAVFRWKACFQWIEALWAGRNYPGDPETRNFLEELKPPPKGDRNLNLETLYTEVAKIRQKNSNWLWHLSRSGD